MIKIKYIFLIPIVILSLYFIYNNVKYNRFYEYNYYKVMLLDNNSYYHDVVSVYGTPEEIICNKEDINDSTYYNYTIVYSDFRFSITSINREGIEFARTNKYITVTSDKFKFGPSKICVGTTKEQVRDVYKKYRKTKYISADSNENVDVYFDNHTRIEYHYNNNIVVKIVFYLYYY